MAMLQAKNECRIIQGGYAGEGHGFLYSGFEHWTDVDDDGNTTVQYYYRDSNAARDSSSTRVVVRVKDRWYDYSRDADTNRVTFKVDTTVENIVVDGKQGYPSASPGRCIEFGSSASSLVWGQSCHLTNFQGTILGSSVNVQTRTVTLDPQTESSSTGLYYHNCTQGYCHRSEEKYHDTFWMGTFFRNNLPKVIPAPTLTRLLQDPLICEYMVSTDWTFHVEAPSDSGAHTYRLTISENSDFSDSLYYDATYEGQTIIFADIAVKPTLHYYWKIDMINDPVYVMRTASGEFTAMAVIKPSEVVPAFSDDDCANLSNNVPVGEWPDW